jgi:hypothetical protein
MSEDVNTESIDFSGNDSIGQQEYDDANDFTTASLSEIKPIYDKAGLKKWLDPDVDIRGIVLHHTWSPTTCNGIGTIKAIRSYHLSHGFSDIAANFYSTDELGGIIGYTARSLYKSNYAHSYVNKSWSQVPYDLGKRFNYNRQYCNSYAIGIETIGNFDSQDPKTSVAMDHSIQVMATICEVYNLNVEKDIWFHNFFEYKSCPGTKVKLDWIKSEVKKEMANENIDCKDLPAKNYQKEALEFCKNNGILTGDSTGNLMPQCNLSRGDMAVMLFRLVNYLENK